MQLPADDPNGYYEPTFCCCEFIDRHGRKTHLSDASACDEVIVGVFTCSPQACDKVLADCDDRIRLPQFNGAVHAGFDGALPVLLLPLMGNMAARGPIHAALLAIATPPLLVLVHLRTLRARRQPRFFLGWTVCTFWFGNIAFTLLVGEHVPFGAWLACAVLQGAAAVCASQTRTPPRNAYHGPTADDRTASSDSEEVSMGVDEKEVLIHSDASALLPLPAKGDGKGQIEGETVECASGSPHTCAFCGMCVAGYDHHCIWINACIGSHNHGVFLRGCTALLFALACQGSLCALQAIQRGRWGAEAVLAAYACLLCFGLLALLGAQALNFSRGLTAHSMRQLRRESKPVPAPSCAKLVKHLRIVCGA